MQVDVSIVDGRNFCSHGNNSAKVQRERNANNNTPSFHWASQSRISNLKTNPCILLICPNPSTVLITFFPVMFSSCFVWTAIGSLSFCLANGKWRWHDGPKYLMAFSVSFLRLMKFSAVCLQIKFD